MPITQRAWDSFHARVIIPGTQQYFEYTKWGKQIKNFRSQFNGKRCFFIGNGPSLRADDLTALHEHGEITFAFNRIYHIFEDTPWRPSFYISQDEKTLQGCADEVDALELPVKLIPIQMKWYYNVDIRNACYFNLNFSQQTVPENFRFSDAPMHEIFCADTAMYTAAQLASYMGFREIYLLGVDHHFHISRNEKGEILVDDSVKDYFSDRYNPDRENLYIPNTDKSTHTYEAMKYHCDRRKIRVFNATRGGKLEVFPRVSFDDIICKATE